jgi:hypothetical protein
VPRPPGEISPTLLRAVNVPSASTGRHDYEILEEAHHRYLTTRQARASRAALNDFLAQVSGQARASDEDAIRLAYPELHAARRVKWRDGALRVVLDPGVLVAVAIARRGVCAQVVQGILDERCRIVVCPALLTELEEMPEFV